MSWICKAINGTEKIFESKPCRNSSVIFGRTYSYWATEELGCDDIDHIVACADGGSATISIMERGIDLPSGSIKKLIGRDLTWEDEPVELRKN